LILQGYHDKAIDRLVQHCKGEELLVQLKKMLKYRHERSAKLEENASDLKREIQALKAAGQHTLSFLYMHSPDIVCLCTLFVSLYIVCVFVLFVCLCVWSAWRA
jgi:hypothetical protein